MYLCSEGGGRSDIWRATMLSPSPSGPWQVPQVMSKRLRPSVEQLARHRHGDRRRVARQRLAVRLHRAVGLAPGGQRGGSA